MLLDRLNIHFLVVRLQKPSFIFVTVNIRSERAPFEFILISHVHLLLNFDLLSLLPPQQPLS